MKSNTPDNYSINQAGILLRSWLSYRYLNVILDGDVGPGNGGRYSELFSAESVAFADLVQQDFHRADIHFRQVANAALRE